MVAVGLPVVLRTHVLRLPYPAHRSTRDAVTGMRCRNQPWRHRSVLARCHPVRSRPYSIPMVASESAVIVSVKATVRIAHLFQGSDAPASWREVAELPLG
jgi:hypothetical protein